MPDFSALKQFILLHFAYIVQEVSIRNLSEMRVFLIDTSFVDIWYSLRNSHKYSYHWERQHIDGTIYRHDNAPHIRWIIVATFPKHFHSGSELNVAESHISNVPTEAVYFFLTLVREKLADIKFS